eukprot:IDg18124t1
MHNVAERGMETSRKHSALAQSPERAAAGSCATNDRRARKGTRSMVWTHGQRGMSPRGALAGGVAVLLLSPMRKLRSGTMRIFDGKRFLKRNAAVRVCYESASLTRPFEQRYRKNVQTRNIIHCYAALLAGALCIAEHKISCTNNLRAIAHQYRRPSDTPPDAMTDRFPRTVHPGTSVRGLRLAFYQPQKERKANRSSASSSRAKLAECRR